MSAAFDRLSPALQYQIVNSLGFDRLRPVQELAIGPILDGRNCLVLAPTAGGKTEAAFFPLLSVIDAADWRPVSVVYVAPIRALLNNQEPRISRYAGVIGRRVFAWHGDVGASARRTFLREPTDILLTTPESLEVMLMSPNVPARQLFRTLRAVVIDEVHAFAGDDRGGHLSAVLERLGRICGYDVQRIALSATVGNPDVLLDWVAGSSARAREVVYAPGQNAAADLALDFVGSEENAARMIAELHPGKKRLVFMDSRRGVESIGRSLRALGVDAYVTHSSLSLDERGQAEQAFSSGRDCVIVATSALELGIDIGDLDHVLQVNAPSTVAAFLQRMGRTGRRPGTRPNCTFLATNEDSLLQSAALLHLHGRGFVEPIEPRRRAAHLLAHQLLALCIQERGVPESDWWAWVAHASAFSELSTEDRRELVDHMLGEDILISDGGRLSLGKRGERLYGFRNFMELYAVFSTPQSLVVQWGMQEVGTIDAWFVSSQELDRLTFTLGARAWRASSVDWTKGVVHAVPAEHNAHARWYGRGKLLHAPMCRAIREVLTTDGEALYWSRRAREQLRTQREAHGFLSPEGLALIDEGTGYQLWTFAGGRANNLIARTMESLVGEKVVSNNLSIGFRSNAGQSEVAIRQALGRLKDEHRPNLDDALRFAADCAHGRLTKFQPCLSSRLEAQYLADALTDSPVAAEAVREVISQE